MTLWFFDSITKFREGDDSGIWNLREGLSNQYASLIKLSELRFEEIPSPGPAEPASDDKRSATSTNIDHLGGSDRDEGDSVDDEEDDKDETSLAATYASFCHTSIDQYFRDPMQGQVSSSDDYPPIGVDSINAKLALLKTCFEVICEPEKLPASNALEVVQAQAFWHWLHYLVIMTDDIHELSSAQRIDIGTL